MRRTIAVALLSGPLNCVGANATGRPRRLVSSDSPPEPRIGYSWAVRSGPWVSVAGTAPTGPHGATIHVDVGDVHAQSVRRWDIAEAALRDAGAARTDVVVRIRVMLVDCDRWQDADRAHRERFADLRPACTNDPTWPTAWSEATTTAWRMAPAQTPARGLRPLDATASHHN